MLRKQDLKKKKETRGLESADYVGGRETRHGLKTTNWNVDVWNGTVTDYIYF